METIDSSSEKVVSNVEYGGRVTLNLCRVLEQKNLSFKDSKECKEFKDRINREPFLSEKQIADICNITNKKIREDALQPHTKLIINL